MLPPKRQRQFVALIMCLLGKYLYQTCQLRGLEKGTAPQSTTAKLTNMSACSKTIHAGQKAHRVDLLSLTSEGVLVWGRHKRTHNMHARISTGASSDHTPLCLIAQIRIVFTCLTQACKLSQVACSRCSLPHCRMLGWDNFFKSSTSFSFLSPVIFLFSLRTIT